MDCLDSQRNLPDSYLIIGIAPRRASQVWPRRCETASTKTIPSHPPEGQAYSTSERLDTCLCLYRTSSPRSGPLACEEAVLP